MEEFLLCIHTIRETSLDDLRESVLKKDVGILSYAVIILGSTFEETQDILLQNQLRALFQYGAGLPVLNMLPFAEKVEADGKTEYYASIPELYTLDEANKLWRSSVITSARLSFNEWLISSDAALDVPYNRVCVMLRRCMDQSKLSFESSTEEVKQEASSLCRKKVEYKHYQSRADRLLTLDAIAQMIIDAALTNENIPTSISMAIAVKEKGIWKNSVGRLQNILTAKETPVLHRLVNHAKKRPEDTTSKKYRDWREEFQKTAALCRASLVQRHDAGLLEKDRTTKADKMAGEVSSNPNKRKTEKYKKKENENDEKNISVEK